MASEYWKWKFRDVQPDEKKELTPEEKRKNWWHYHKWHLATGVVLVGIAANLVWNALGIGEIKPDYQFAYVGTYLLPDDTAAALENALSGLGEDLNGDGQVVVSLRQYASGGETGMGMAATAEVQLMADIVEGESYFFLLENPEQFQQSYRTLCYLDGTLPEEGDYSAEGTYLPWKSCPVLRELSLGGYSYEVAGQSVAGDNQELLSELSIARRGFWTEEDAPYPEGCAALWNKLTEGAIVITW